MPFQILLEIQSPNLIAVLVPLVCAAAAASLTFFVMKAIHRKKHPDEEYMAEEARRRKEKQKLQSKTMSAVSDRLHGRDSDGESAPNGLRSGKHNKKKKKN